MLAVSSRFKVVVGVSKVCQVSQLHPAIDDLATRELGSMLASLFTLQASLAFSSWATVLFFLFAEPRCWDWLQHNLRQRRISIIFYLFIQCRLTANTFFLSAKFSRAAHEHVVTGLKNKASGLLTDLILYYRVRQTWHSES